MASTTVKNFRTTTRKLACSEVFFKCLEVLAGDGYGVMRDSIRGAAYNPILANTGQVYDPETGIGLPGTPLVNIFWMENGVTASNSVRPTNTIPIPLCEGSWPNLAQRKVIIFGCGVLRIAGQARIPFGNGQAILPGWDGNISVSLSGAMHGLVRGANGNLTNGIGITYAPVCNTSLTGKFVALVGEYIPATAVGDGSFHYKVIDANGAIMLGDDAVSLLEHTRPIIIQADCTPHLNNFNRVGGLDFFGIRMFSFNNDLPPEAVREVAYKWMMRHYAAGHREEPPHFVGYT